MDELEHILYSMRVRSASRKTVSVFRSSRYSYAVYIPKELAVRAPLLRITGEAVVCGRRVSFALFLPSDTPVCDEGRGVAEKLQKCIKACMEKCVEMAKEHTVCATLCSELCVATTTG